MLKEIKPTMFFFIGVLLLHVILLQLFPILYFGKEIILSYFIFAILEITRIFLFYLDSTKKIDIGFAQVFIVFTTIQLLVVFAFVVIIKLFNEGDIKHILLPFAVIFCLLLAFQVIQLLKKLKESN